MNRRRRRQLFGLGFALPALLFVGAYMVYPLLQSFYISLTRYNFVFDDRPVFVGVQNYTRAFADADFRLALKNTLVYAAMDFTLLMSAGLAIALLLNEVKRFSAFFRTAVFVPIVVPASLASLVFAWFFQGNFGLFNHILRSIGLGGLAREWLANGDTAMGALVLASLWGQIGFIVIVFLAGLQAISREIIDAARVDGCDGWRSTWHVVLPNLRESYAVAGIWATIQALKVFVYPMVMTGGAPANATLVLYQYIYQQAFQVSEVGYASAMAYILALMVLAFSMINLKLNSAKQ